VNLLEQFQKELIAFGAAAVMALLRYFFRERVKLQWARPHSFVFILPNPAVMAAENTGQQPPQNLPDVNFHTGAVVVANRGRIAASDVEVTFNLKPPYFNVWPVLPYTEEVDVHRRFTMRFRYIAPGEQFQVEMISPNPLPEVMSVRCKEGIGKMIPMRPMRVFPQWFNYGALMLLFLGVTSVVYMILKIGEIFIK
jgi:hypothetical protein